MKTLSYIKNTRLRALLTILLVIALLFANVTILAHAATNSTSTNVISSISALDSVTMLLASMGVISVDSAGDYNLTKNVTRAEFAKMMVMVSSYKDLVNTTSYSSPYKDVPAKNWAAPYIKIAVSNGLMSGYSDGTFRPGSPITLEQGVNSVLAILGYSASDFKGAFPAAQMNVYYNNGLSANISGGVGTLMTKADAANLLYNMLGTTIKDGSKTYAESIGYSLNASGEVDYAKIVSDNMNGPYTVRSSNWANELGLSSGLTIYKNGSLVTKSDVKTYDIIYYSKSKGSVWVYKNRVTGIYEKASPSQNAVTSVTVSGTDFQLESSAAFAALSSTGNLKVGSAVTLLLGKNGGVADAVASTELRETTVLYVESIGSKTYQNADGTKYSSKYVKGIQPNGSEVEYTVNGDWIEAGNLIKITFDEDGTMNVNPIASRGGVSGEVNASLSTIGSTKIAPNAIIIDTSLGNHAVTSLSRLDGVNIDNSKVLYYEASAGQVSTLLLDDITGDTAKYGVITSRKVSDNSSSFEYLINGVKGTLSLSEALNAHVGGAKFYGESGTIDTIKSLYSLGNVKSFKTSQVAADDKIGTYPISSNTAVYSESSGTYKSSTLSAALAAYQANKNVTFYYDKNPAEGGCIRVIVHQ